jgi:predicted MFS family arabinose efflux permease
MAAAIGVKTSLSGFIAMIPFLGYAAGLFFLVPLADLVENRRLVLLMLSAATISSIGIILAPNPTTLFVLLFTLGAGSSTIQVLVPIAAAMTEPERRGRVIGDIMSGLMVGILLARPAASLLAGVWGWKAFYIASAALLTLLGSTLALRLETRRSMQATSYLNLLASLWHLLAGEPVLRHRSFSAAIVMAAFNFFWTTIAYVLGDAPLHLSQTGIAVFALVGAGGAIITPMVGRWSDRGLGKRITAIAHIVMIAGFGVAALSGLSTSASPYAMLVGLGVSALMLDMGVLGDQTVGRYMINQLKPEARGRLNGIFVGIFFVGGAVGSALSGMLWSTGGWGAICIGGAALGLFAFVIRK